MLQTFLAHGFLLAEHSVYKNLAQELLASATSRARQRWILVCERKEDLVSIRTQIFSLLNQQNKLSGRADPLQSWVGVSLYTPDTLVRNFALTLSHNSATIVGAEANRLFRSPYIDIVEQERLTRLILLKLGYAGSDVAPLAKQILTLADTALPPDESLLSVLLEVQQTQHSLKQVADVPDVSLRTILVAYQLVQKILSKFCRLQSFIGEYWGPHFQTHLSSALQGENGSEEFLWPQKFLDDPLLWIAAPEYTRATGNERKKIQPQAPLEQTYRPGNFQASWIDALREGLFRARQISQSHANSTGIQTWWARTLIPSQTIVPQAAVAQVKVIGSQAALANTFETLHSNSDARTQFLLGDMNARDWNVIRADGSGVHSLTPADFENNLNKKSHAEQNADHPPQQSSNGASLWANPAGERVTRLHDEFNKDWQRLEPFTELIENALNQYNLSPSLRKHGVSFDLMLHRFFDSETFSIGELGEVAGMPPALSLLPGIETPEQFIVLGSPHSTTSPSFHLRLLNAVFHQLRSKQVQLDPIASEQSYRGYWQSIFTRGCKITFLVRGYQDVEAFPTYAKAWCQPAQFKTTTISDALPASSFERWLAGSQQIFDPEWKRLLREPKTPNEPHTLAVTAFEDYVECPLRFYWLTLHRSEADAQAALQPDVKVMGQRAHSAAECFFRSLRHIALTNESNEPQTNLWRKLITQINEEFVESEIFLSNDSTLWNKALLSAFRSAELSLVQMNHAKELAGELEKAIFSPADPAVQTGFQVKQSALKQKLTREGVRRAFRKMIQSELLLLGASNDTASQSGADENSKETRAAFLEQPFQLEIAPGLLLTGRIDRVDTHPSGDKIIDYKTSKVPKKEPALVLNPLEATPYNRLSVQGAIYCLAWARKQAEEASDDERPRGVSAFTLLRLKTLDLSRNPFVSCAFRSPLQFNDDAYAQLFDSYRTRAETLVSGHFPARPLYKEMCKSCALKMLCPTALRPGEEES